MHKTINIIEIKSKTIKFTQIQIVFKNSRSFFRYHKMHHINFCTRFVLPTTFSKEEHKKDIKFWSTNSITPIDFKAVNGLIIPLKLVKKENQLQAE